MARASSRKWSSTHLGRSRIRILRDDGDLSVARSGTRRLAAFALAMLARALPVGRRLLAALPRRGRIATASADKLPRSADNALSAVLALRRRKTAARAHHLSGAADRLLIAALALRGRIAGSPAHILARTADYAVVAVLAQRRFIADRPARKLAYPAHHLRIDDNRVQERRSQDAGQKCVDPELSVTCHRQH